MKIESILKEIGFEENEANVYIHLLKKGRSSQQTISDETGILRQTIYELMKKMESKGYVSTSLVGRRKFYSPIQPQVLLKKLEEKNELFISAIPALENIKKQEKINISSESFIGLQGLKNLFNLTLNSSTEILWIANKNLSDKVFQGFYWHNYKQKRLEKKIPIKLLIEPTEEKDWNTNKKDWRETRRLSLVKEMASSMVLFDNKVIIYSLSEGQFFGTFIQDTTTKSSLEKIFFNLWKQAR